MSCYLLKKKKNPLNLISVSWIQKDLYVKSVAVKVETKF